MKEAALHTYHIIYLLFMQKITCSSYRKDKRKGRKPIILLLSEENQESIYVMFRQTYFMCVT